MKTMRVNIMVSIFMATGLLLNSFIVNSQEVELDRLERKEMRKAQQEANFRALDSLLASRKFILVADFLENKWGDRISVIPTLNFIRVNETEGVLQTGSSTGIGYNGVGGVTAEGTVDDLKITRNLKNLSFTIRFSLTSQIGHYDIMMSISAGNYASAVITGLYPGKLTWEGHLESLRSSRIYKGTDTI